MFVSAFVFRCHMSLCMLCVMCCVMLYGLLFLFVFVCMCVFALKLFARFVCNFLCGVEGFAFCAFWLYVCVALKVFVGRACGVCLNVFVCY